MTGLSTIAPFFTTTQSASVGGPGSLFCWQHFLFRVGMSWRNETKPAEVTKEMDPYVPNSPLIPPPLVGKYFNFDLSFAWSFKLLLLLL